VLSQIQELFYSSADGMHGSPSKSAPVAFAAGFGNHETDVMAYTAAAIPPTHIFVLDKASNLRIHACGTEVQSYTGLLQHLPVLFPPLRPADAGPYFGSPGKEAPAYGATMLAREAAPSVNAAHASHMQDDRGGHNSASRRHAAPAAPKSWGGVSDLTGLWNFQEQPSHMRNSMESTANTVRASAREIMSNIIPGVRDLSCARHHIPAAPAPCWLWRITPAEAAGLGTRGWSAAIRRLTIRRLAASSPATPWVSRLGSGSSTTRPCAPAT
jgi:hypothetical protein